MKIVQVAHSFLPHTKAGTEVYTYVLSRALSGKNEVSVFFRVKNSRKKEYAVTEGACDGFKTFAINHTFSHCRCFEQTYEDKRIDEAFARLLDAIKPDCVHIQHLLFLSLGIVREAKKRGIPVVCTLNDYWLICHKGQFIKDDLSVCQRYDASSCQACLLSQLSIRGNAMRFYTILRKTVPNMLLQFIKRAYIKKTTSGDRREAWLDRMLLEREEAIQELIGKTDLFISPTDFMRNKFIAFGVPAEKITLLPHGIPRASDSTDKSGSRSLRFGFIGTLLPMKGIDILIEAFKQIKNRNVELLIFGKLLPYAGYEGYMHVLRKTAGKDSRIRLMGDFDHKEAGKVFSGLDVLVVPSIWPENWPLVIAEAFLYKTPVVASRIGGIPELIEDGKNGLLFNAGDAHDLKDKLQRFIDDRPLLDALKNTVTKVKTIEEHAIEIEQIYAWLIEKSLAVA